MGRTQQQYLHRLVSVKAGHVLQTAGIMLVGFLALLQLLKHDVEVREQGLRAELAQQGMDLISGLEQQLTSNLHLAEGLAATIVAIPDINKAQLDAAIQRLFHDGRYMRNIGVAPGNRISNIYPLKGNEGAMGMYYPEVPAQWVEVKAAIDSRQPRLSGPLQLVQGGIGLINRKPVFLDDGSYWGIISLVLDMDGLLQGTGFVSGHDATHLLLYKTNSANGQLEVIHDDSAVLDSAPVTLQLNIPGADWKLALAPAAGWSPDVFLSRLQVGLGVLFILGVALAFLAFRTVITSLKAKDAHMRAVLDSSMDSVVVVDRQGYIVDCNHAASGLFGYAESELLHQHASRLYLDERLRREELYSDAAATPGQSRRIEISGRRSNGEQFAMELSIGGMRRGGEGSFVWVMRDISSRKQAEAALQRLASVDPLTGAMNRRAFMQEGERLFEIARRYRRSLSVLAIDADHFKRINDTWGNATGDKVLVAIVQVLRASVRQADLVSRFGGEEFLVLMPETDAAAAMQAAEKVRLAPAAEEVTDAEGCLLRFTCSIGVSSMDVGMTSITQLLREADEALYEAKGRGRNCCVPYGEPAAPVAAKLRSV